MRATAPTHSMVVTPARAKPPAPTHTRHACAGHTRSGNQRTHACAVLLAALALAAPASAAVIHGTRGPDLIVGTNGDDILYGQRGGDIIIGRGGHDVIYGGRGSNLLWGGWGHDVIVSTTAGRERVRCGHGYDLHFSLGDALLTARFCEEAR